MRGTVGRSGSPCSTPTRASRSGSGAETGSRSLSSSESRSRSGTRLRSCPGRPGETGVSAQPAVTRLVKGSANVLRRRRREEAGRAAQAAVPAAQHRGPWDAADDYPQSERIDCGSLLVPVREGFDVEINMADVEGSWVA